MYKGAKIIQKTLSPRTGKPTQKQLGKSKRLMEMRAHVIARSLISGKTEEQALLDAGYSPSSARNPSQVLGNPVMKRIYSQILDAAGVTDEACARVIADAMHAMKSVSCVTGKEADSKSVDFVDIDDHHTRLKAVDMVHKVRGRYIDKTVITGPDGGPIKVKAVELTDEELLNIASRGRPRTAAKKKSPCKPT